MASDDPDADLEGPIETAKDAAKNVAAEAGRVGEAVQQWVQDVKLRYQIVLGLALWLLGNTAFLLIAPHLARLIGRLVTTLTTAQLTLLTIIQMILTLLGIIVSQNLTLMRSINKLQNSVDDMDTMPQKETDGGDSSRRFPWLYRENPVSTSGGGFLGGAIIGGAWGASFGWSGVVGGILAGAIIGDSIEQELIVRRKAD